MHLANRPNILLVTECNLFQKVVAKVLDKEYLLLVAKTSQEAFSIYRNQEINLAVFDISSAEVDGSSLCKTWRQLPQFRDLPMILLTSRSSQIAKEEDVAYLKQPVELSQLRKMVKKLLRLKHQSQCTNPKVFVESARQIISDSDFFKLEYI